MGWPGMSWTCHGALHGMACMSCCMGAQLWHASIINNNNNTAQGL